VSAWGYLEKRQVAFQGAGGAISKLRSALLLLVLICAALPGVARGDAAPITLPDGRGLSPAGRMVAAGDFPAGALLVGGGLLVDTTGSQPNEILGFDPATLALLGRRTPSGPISANAAPWAQTGHLALSPDGSTLYAAGGATQAVEAFTIAGPGTLVPSATLTAPGFVGGVAADSDGRHLFATLPFDYQDRYDKGHQLVRLDRDGQPASTVSTGRQPWDVAVGVAHGRALVATANRADGTVTVLDAHTLAPVSEVSVGRQPAAPTFTSDGHLLVLASLDDALVELDPLSGRVTRRLALGPSAGLLGSAPSAMALSPDGATAYVALSAENSVAVVSRPASGDLVLRGRIPTGTYPTSVVLDAAHGALLITTGKGVEGGVGTPVGAPVAASPALAPGPTGLGVSGTLEAIPVPDAPTLAGYTAQVDRNNSSAGLAAAAQCPVSPQPSIRHVIYVIRENKTYDEVLGDEPGGSANNLMYPRAVTPNVHALAERFGLLQAFYSNEEVSDTGHQATMGSVANDWVQRLSQQAYGLDGAPRQGAELGDGSSTLWSPNDYLLDAALRAHLSFRDYGEFFRQDQNANGPAITPALDAHIVHDFPGFGFSPDVPDTKRIAFWEKGFRQDVASGTLPQLEVLYLPEDHTTMGLSSTPQAQVADADLALGRLVEDLSHSPYWPSSALFMTEDDPQSGTDHVDEHRTVGLVVSPLARSGQQVSEHLSQTGMLRTIEQLVGLPPLTQLDAAATPFTGLLGAQPDLRPFTALTPSAPSPGRAKLASLRAAARSAVPDPGRLDSLAPAVQVRLTELAHAQVRAAYRTPASVPEQDRPRVDAGTCAAAAPGLSSGEAPASPIAAPSLGLPSARRCLGRRLVMRLARGLRRVSIYLNGRLTLRVSRGGRQLVLILPARGTRLRVTVTATRHDGRRVRATRTYARCRRGGRARKSRGRA